MLPRTILLICLLLVALLGILKTEMISVKAKNIGDFPIILEECSVFLKVQYCNLVESNKDNNGEVCVDGHQIRQSDYHTLM